MEILFWVAVMATYMTLMIAMTNAMMNTERPGNSFVNFVDGFMVVCLWPIGFCFYAYHSTRKYLKSL